jgi:hypothetical protein
MSRPIMRQQDAARGSWEKVSPGILPEGIGDDRFTPDPRDLLPGDVILSRGDGLGARAVQRVQDDRSFLPEHAGWTHVALFLGGGRLVDGGLNLEGALVIEAVPFRGVRVVTLPSHAAGRELLVRRDLLLGAPPAPAHGCDFERRLEDMEKRHLIVASALAYLGQGYGHGSALRIGWQRLLARFGGAATVEPAVAAEMLCSNLVRSAYFKIRRDVSPEVVGTILPANLSASHILTDQRIGWVEIGR